jgi:hypothetical protein
MSRSAEQSGTAHKLHGFKIHPSYVGLLHLQLDLMAPLDYGVKKREITLYLDKILTTIDIGKPLRSHHFCPICKSCRMVTLRR